MEPAEGSVRFECPEEFASSPFAPGAPFSQELLQSPSKQLFLIRAPVNFSPESLEGHTVPLLGFQTKAVQADGAQKVYGVQMTCGDQGSSARLLVPTGRLDHLTCAPPFSGSLSFCERYGDPNANQPLFPVVARPALQIPEGLKQRFLPFGGQLKRPHHRPPDAPEEAPPKKKKKRKQESAAVDSEQRLPLLLKQEPWEGRGLEVPSRAVAVPAEGPSAEATCIKQQQQQQQEGAVLCGLRTIRQLPEEGCQRSSGLEGSSQDCLLSAETEEWRHKSRKKKKRQKVKREDLLLAAQLPELQPCLQAEPQAQAGENSSSEAGGSVQRKHKKKRKHEEAAAWMSPASGQAGEELCPPGSILAVVKEEPGTAVPSSKPKKKKKTDQETVEHEAETGLLAPSSIKQEVVAGDELDIPSGQGAGGPGEPSDPSGESLSQKHHKKKKKKHKREGLDFIKQE